MIELEFILRAILITLFVVGFITEIVIPLIVNRPLFPTIKGKSGGELVEDFDNYRLRQLEKDLKRAKNEQHEAEIEAQIQVIREQIQNKRKT